jgi:hypothetical protein
MTCSSHLSSKLSKSSPVPKWLSVRLLNSSRSASRLLPRIASRLASRLPPLTAPLRAHEMMGMFCNVLFIHILTPSPNIGSRLGRRVQIIYFACSLPAFMFLSTVFQRNVCSSFITLLSMLRCRITRLSSSHSSLTKWVSCGAVCSARGMLLHVMLCTRLNGQICSL